MIFLFTGCAGFVRIISVDLSRANQKWVSHYEFVRKRPSICPSKHKLMFWAMNPFEIKNKENLSMERKVFCVSKRTQSVCLLSCEKMWNELNLKETPYDEEMVEIYGYCDVVGAYAMAKNTLKNRWEKNFDGKVITYIRPEMLRTELKPNGREWLKYGEKEDFELRSW